MWHWFLRYLHAYLASHAQVCCQACLPLQAEHVGSAVTWCFHSLVLMLLLTRRDDVAVQCICMHLCNTVHWQCRSLISTQAAAGPFKLRQANTADSACRPAGRAAATACCPAGPSGWYQSQLHFKWGSIGKKLTFWTNTVHKGSFSRRASCSWWYVFWHRLLAALIAC